MEIKPDKTLIDKEFTKLDEFVIDFIAVLDKAKIEYVIVSGYVSILLGRSRATEDVDILIPKIDFSRFKELWDNLGEFECMNSDLEKSYETLEQGPNIRFYKKSRFIPNIELKFSKNELDEYTLKNKYKIIAKEHVFYVSPPHLQIPYKLFLGSEKDIEDARFLYLLFKDIIDKNKMDYFIEKLKVTKKVKNLQ